MTTLKRASIKVTGIEKFVSAGTRKIRGTATTDALDRVGDIVDPAGGKWILPLSLLWQHKHDHPVGWVTSVKRSGNGLAIEAEIAAGIGRADEVWAMVDAGLVNSFSIGFIGTKSEPLKGGGRRFTEWELIEVSIVTIPANPDAKIQRNVGAVRLVRRSDAIPLVKPRTQQ